jgi:hypothetical protein
VSGEAGERCREAAVIGRNYVAASRHRPPESPGLRREPKGSRLDAISLQLSKCLCGAVVSTPARPVGLLVLKSRTGKQKGRPVGRPAVSYD